MLLHQAGSQPAAAQQEAPRQAGLHAAAGAVCPQRLGSGRGTRRASPCAAHHTSGSTAGALKPTSSPRATPLPSAAASKAGFTPRLSRSPASCRLLLLLLLPSPAPASPDAPGDGCVCMTLPARAPPAGRCPQLSADPAAAAEQHAAQSGRGTHPALAGSAWPCTRTTTPLQQQQQQQEQL